MYRQDRYIPVSFAGLESRSEIDEGYYQVVDIDLSKFFDRVNHDLLMVRVARKVGDKRVLRLIGIYLKAGVEVDGETLPRRHAAAGLIYFTLSLFAGANDQGYGRRTGDLPGREK